jgi:hypothetical protein
LALAISDELRRFLVAGTLSVPHVEAILQLRQAPPAAWNAERLGARIYVPVARARDLLKDLQSIGIVSAQAENDDVYHYQPATSELAALLNELVKAYSEQLVVITQLIHTADERKAQKFSDAFRFRKET